MSRDQPYCRLIICRSLAPVNLWHWSVEMPDGHVAESSRRSYDNLPEIMQDACTFGTSALIRAETAQAQHDDLFYAALHKRSLTP